MALKPKHPSSAPPVLEAHKTASVADMANLKVRKALQRAVGTVPEAALVEADIAVVAHATDYKLNLGVEVVQKVARIGWDDSWE